MHFQAVKSLKDSKKSRPEPINSEIDRKKIKHNLVENLTEKEKLEVLKALENEPEVSINSFISVQNLTFKFVHSLFN